MFSKIITTYYNTKKKFKSQKSKCLPLNLVCNVFRNEMSIICYKKLVWRNTSKIKSH
ncbi:hypothetical protein HanHA300_Chr11g0411661 [Helianthus annuus]|nr:hypothetical protein HanHA300_Chr11g0411661 [Helianthus annuus]KAJ0518248.1 hypothetical protein HanHA89_Chr11g0435331 [Helianthus annuus]KAJ0686280.1 hypothetical protein HanLR1_Chr11g0412991 [Helianthus annuus]